MTTYDYDYFDTRLPYQIPGQLPDYDPWLMRTQKMRQYHDSFPNRDSLVDEAAEIRGRLQALPDIQPEHPEPESFFPRNYGGLEVSDILGLPLWALEKYWQWYKEQTRRTGQGLAAPVGSPEWEHAYMPFIGASAPLNVNAAKAAMSGRGWLGKGSPGASETVTMHAPEGGNTWGRPPQQRVTKPEITPSGTDALDYVVSSRYSPAQSAELRKIISEASQATPPLPEEGMSVWDLGIQYINPEAWKNARMRSSGRQLRGAGDPLKYTIADAINDLPEALGPYLNQAWNAAREKLPTIDASKLRGKAAEFLGPYREVAGDVGDLLGEKLQRGMRWGINRAKDVGLMRDPELPANTNLWDFIQGNKPMGIPKSPYADRYRQAGKGSWQREAIKDVERDIRPVISDFVDRHPLAVLLGTPVGLSALVAEKAAEYLNPSTRNLRPLETLKSAVTTAPSTSSEVPWWSNYDFLWGG